MTNLFKKTTGFALAFIISIGIVAPNSVYADEIDKNIKIDCGIIGSEIEMEFDNEVEAIRYLKDVEKKSFEEIDAILSQNRDIPYLDDFVEEMLNSKELKLYKKNRAKAILCLGNGKFAIEYSEDMYENDALHNGNGDAFRHALWNYGMAIDVGQDFAKKWSDAHEYGAPENPKLEKKMDLYNNSVGLQLAKDNPGTIGHSTFKSKTQEAVRNGKCKIIVDDELVKSNSNGEK